MTVNIETARGVIPRGETPLVLSTACAESIGNLALGDARVNSDDGAWRQIAARCPRDKWLAEFGGDSDMPRHIQEELGILDAVVASLEATRGA